MRKQLEWTWGRAFLVLLLLIFLVACTSAPGPKSSKIWVDDITVEIWASTACAPPGETVTFRATVTNYGSRPFAVELNDQFVLDIQIKDSPGNANEEIITVHWSDGKPLTADQTRLELNPGQSRTIEMQRTMGARTSALYVSARFIPTPRRTNAPVDPLVAVSVLCAGY